MKHHRISDYVPLKGKRLLGNKMLDQFMDEVVCALCGAALIASESDPAKLVCTNTACRHSAQ